MSSSPNSLKREPLFFVFVILALLFVFCCSLSLGSVKIPFQELLNTLLGIESEKAVYQKIVLDIRLPKAITAMFAGAALSLAGLQMQTIFRNPLADPFILGVNSGASLGVAIVVLLSGWGSAALLASLGFLGNFTIVIAASMGSILVLSVVMILSTRVNLMTLLIIGLMIGYATSAIVSILMFFAMPERLQAFFAWTFGNFGTVTWSHMWVFLPTILIALGMCLISSKPMNAFLLGEAYARSMGVNILFWRSWILLSASLLTGSVTGFCGPIGFIGVAVPHLCRSLLQTSDHRRLFPAVILMGALIALLADLVAQVPGSRTILPLNAITSLIGAPVIIWVLVSKKNLRQAFSNN